MCFYKFCIYSMIICIFAIVVLASLGLMIIGAVANLNTKRRITMKMDFLTPQKMFAEQRYPKNQFRTIRFERH